MPTLTLHSLRDPESSGLIHVLAQIHLADVIHACAPKFSDGIPLETLQREAERMALERWPGEMSVRLMLTMGDCGDVHGLPTPEAHQEGADEEPDEERE